MQKPEGELAERIISAIQRWSDCFGVHFDNKAADGLSQEIYNFYLEGVRVPDPETNFEWDASEQSWACGFCGSHDSRVGGIKSHIRDNHIVRTE